MSGGSERRATSGDASFITGQTLVVDGGWVRLTHGAAAPAPTASPRATPSVERAQRPEAGEAR